MQRMFALCDSFGGHHTPHLLMKKKKSSNIGGKLGVKTSLLKLYSPVGSSLFSLSENFKLGLNQGVVDLIINCIFSCGKLSPQIRVIGYTMKQRQLLRTLGVKS